MFAYRILPFQISGGPSWLDSLHYDIVAKPEQRPNRSETQEMLQSLLAERFQLEVHRETKELPIYALVLARKDGKLGPGLTESKDCPAVDASTPARPCGNAAMGPNSFTASASPVGGLVSMLSRMMGRSVVDQTGLTQKFDIKMNFTLDQDQLAMMTPPGFTPPTPVEPSGPSIFTALREQLGLKLESQKGPVEIFVIDRAEKPSEN